MIGLLWKEREDMDLEGILELPVVITVGCLKETYVEKLENKNLKELKARFSVYSIVNNRVCFVMYTTDI